jgi:hypothetical protein
METKNSIPNAHAISSWYGENKTDEIKMKIQKRTTDVRPSVFNGFITHHTALKKSAGTRRYGGEKIKKRQSSLPNQSTQQYCYL